MSDNVTEKICEEKHKQVNEKFSVLFDSNKRIWDKYDSNQKLLIGNLVAVIMLCLGIFGNIIFKVLSK